MALGPYLIRRGNALVFRRRIPKQHAAHLSAAYLQVPLRTHLLAEGRLRALRLVAFTDAAFAMLEACEGADMADAATIERVIRELMRFELEAAEAIRGLAPTRGPAEVQAALALGLATRETLRAALVYNDYAAVRAPLAAACARIGLLVCEASTDWRRLARRAAQALIEVAEENGRREQGVYGDSGLIADVARPPGTGIAIPPVAWLLHGPPLPAPPVPSAPAPFGPPAAPLAEDAGGATTIPPSPVQVEAPTRATRATADAAPATDTAPAANPALALGTGPLLPVQATAMPSPVQAPCAPTGTGVGEWSPSPSATGEPGEPSIFAARVAAQIDAQRARNAALGIRPDAERMHMGRAFDAFIADTIAEKGKSWAVNSAPNVRSTKVLFIEINGDFWTDQADELHFALMRNLLRAIPKHHHKSPEQKPILEEIAELDEQEAVTIRRRDAELRAGGADRGTREMEFAKLRRKRMRVATAYRHQQDLQRFARWGVARGLFPRNFMQGLMWSKQTIKAFEREQSDNRRLAWGDKARELFGSRIFTEALDDKGDPLFWAPLIARLAGLREEEVLQLRVPDVDTEDGVPVFRIQQGEGQVLKTEAARRIVPIHSALIALGLLQLVEERRREGQEWLFPQVERSASRDRLTGTFTKTFTRYRIEIGVYDPNRDFHSLRQDFNVTLTDADVPLFVRKRLMGHEVTDVTEINYNAAGRSIHKLAEYVNRIDFDISGIRAPFTSGETLPARRTLTLVKG